MALRPGHLIKRFVATAIPLGPRAANSSWAESHLLGDEVLLWRQMKRADRRHACGVARRVERALGDVATRPVVAAALLHDVGKIDANFGAYRRVVATVSGLAVRNDPSDIDDWARSRGLTRRVGLYLQHPAIGGDLLGVAGSDPLTEAWAREHHLPEDQWTVASDIARALKHADDD